MQIGLQTFTIRKDLKNQRSILSAFKKIKSMGINSLEIARISFDLKAGLITPAISDTYLGNGTLDFKRIISAAETAGVEQLSIEQETRVPYDHLRKSIQYIIGR